MYCEKMCDGNNTSAVHDNTYSLADMSYVPHFRRLQIPTKNQTNESIVQYDDNIVSSDDAHNSTDEESVFIKTLEISEDLPPLKFVLSEEDAAQFADLDATLEVIREFSKGIMYSEYLESITDGQHHEHGRNNDTDEEFVEACSNVELAWDEDCYFITNRPVTGHKASTICSKYFSDAELSEIESEEVNSLVSEYVKKLDKNSGKPLYQRMTYVYIKDTRHNAKFRNTKLNHQEELFKKSICDLVGCGCMALRSSTGSWHSRICDTRHHALCRRPLRRHGEREAEGGAPTAPTLADGHGV